MKNQQLIKQIEIRIQEIKNNVQHWKEIISQHEQSLLDLTQKLEEIKKDMKGEENK